MSYWKVALRHLRTRAREAQTLSRTFTLSNPVVASNWPPELPPGEPHAITPIYCSTLLKQIETAECEKLKAQRNFQVPTIQPGDLVEVKYELSRSAGTFAVFQGYCIRTTGSGLAGGFALKNVYDGVGVEQFFPIHSTRLLDVKLVKATGKKATEADLRPRTRHYRYQWHTFIRQRHSEGKRVHWRLLRQNPGIMSLEPKLKTELAVLRRRHNMMRREAGLAPYLWPGPYHVHMRKGKEIRAEQQRRMLVYAMDERRKQTEKKIKNGAKNKWVRRPPALVVDATKSHRDILKSLPRDHPLYPGNLPK